MTETIANAVVELARLALWAYAVKNGREVIVHWLDNLQMRPTEQQIVDAARSHGLELTSASR